METVERKRLNVREITCLRSICEATRVERVRNDEMGIRTGVIRELADEGRSITMVWASGDNGRRLGKK